VSCWPETQFSAGFTTGSIGRTAVVWGFVEAVVFGA